MFKARNKLLLENLQKIFIETRQDGYNLRKELNFKKLNTNANSKKYVHLDADVEQFGAGVKILYKY